jgi:serine/threonine-protein kinase RsbT
MSARAVETSIDITGERDIVAARQMARATAERMGFGTIDQSRIATAVSELARNVVRYATDGRGRVHIRDVLTEARVEGIEIVVEDDGPGMADPEEALSEGFTTGRGMGLGLPGTRRLMDEMILESEPGKGTTVTIRKWKR